MNVLLKTHGSGNDFLVGTGEWAERLAEDIGLVVRLCDRRLGIGADGALALTARPPHTVELVYRNADGSRASLCANGVRCAARAAVELLRLPARLTVSTDAGQIAALVRGEVVSVDLPAPSCGPEPIELDGEGGATQAWFAVIGVPHVVVPSPGPVATLDLPRIAPPLRRHPRLGPDGANVSFTQARGDRMLEVRSWERGVEGETLSCGTGVVAAALIQLAAVGGRRVACRTRGGDELEVEALGEPPHCAVRLTGPAVLVAEVVPRPELISGALGRR